jgi:hypothetical protein
MHAPVYFSALFPPHTSPMRISLPLLFCNFTKNSHERASVFIESTYQYIIRNFPTPASLIGGGVPYALCTSFVWNYLVCYVRNINPERSAGFHNSITREGGRN